MSTNTTSAGLERRRSSLRRLLVLVLATVVAAIAVSAAGAARTTHSIHCVTRVGVGCKQSRPGVRTIMPFPFTLARGGSYSPPINKTH